MKNNITQIKIRKSTHSIIYNNCKAVYNPKYINSDTSYICDKV